MNLAMLAGALIGGGIFLIIRALRPQHPDLGDAIATLNGQRPDTRLADDIGRFNIQVRGGRYLATRLRDTALISRAKPADLALLEVADVDYYGIRFTWALAGAVMLPLTTLLYGRLVGAGAIVLLASTPLTILAGALAGWVLFDRNIAARAQQRRHAAAAAVVIYLDLVAIARRGGGGTGSALVSAAAEGTVPMFVRLRETIGRAGLAGITPWDALYDLGTSIDVDQLHTVADIARTAGSHGASITTTLEASAKSMRTAQEAADRDAGNKATARLQYPEALLVLICFVMLLFPAVAGLGGGGL